MAAKDLKATDDSLRAAIVHILGNQPGLEAKKIASLLRAKGWSGLRRREVNSALYRGLSARQFRKDVSPIPRWWVEGVAPSAAQPERNPPSVRDDVPSTLSPNHDRLSTGPAASGVVEESGGWRIVELD